MQTYTDLSLFDQKIFLQKILIISCFFDILLGFIISKINPKELGGYLLYNAEHDFIKTSLLKIQFGLFAYVALYQFGSKHDAPLGSKSEILILGYALFIISQWIYFFYVRPSLKTNNVDAHSIPYRLLSICIDPFVKKDQSILERLPKYKISWNWKCFLFLEFWFLWNGVYGLGMFLLMFYFTLYPIVPGGMNNILIVWLIIRIVFSFFADFVSKAQR
jgi:hypothetical protein